MRQILSDTIAIRQARIKAYAAGEYTFSLPPVITRYWNEESWHNHVRFNDQSISGFLPYSADNHKKAKDAMTKITSKSDKI